MRTYKKRPRVQKGRRVTKECECVKGLKAGFTTSRGKKTRLGLRRRKRGY